MGKAKFLPSLVSDCHPERSEGPGRGGGRGLIFGPPPPRSFAALRIKLPRGGGGGWIDLRAPPPQVPRAHEDQREGGGGGGQTSSKATRSRRSGVWATPGEVGYRLAVAGHRIAETFELANKLAASDLAILGRVGEEGWLIVVPSLEHEVDADRDLVSDDQCGV